MYAMACSAAGRLRDSLCNFLQIGDATFSKNILQLSGKKPCKKQFVDGITADKIITSSLGCFEPYEAPPLYASMLP